MNEPIKGIQADLTGRVSPPTGAPATFDAVPVSSAYVIVLSSVAAIGGFLFGFDSGVINGAVDALANAFGTRAATTGFAVASVLLGCAVGAFLAGTIADIYGRRPTMLLNAVFFLASAFGAGAAGSAGFFMASRILGGLAIGGASVLAPMYISEVAPARMRGRLASLQQMAIVLGLFSAFLSNDILASIAGGAGATLWLEAPAWRWMFWMEAVPAAAFLLGVLFIPESPRFLVAKGKREDARRIFARIGGDAEGLVRQVEQSLKGEHRPRLSDLIIAGTRRMAPVVWVGMGLAAFQQFVGINIIFYYGETLWKLAGISEEVALERNIISGLVSIAAVFAALAVIDKIGRKPLLLIGSTGMALTLGAMAWAFSGAGTDAAGNLMLGETQGYTALVAANLYVIFFNMSWGPVMWVMLGEMFPNQMRGSALAVAGLAQWGSNYLVVQSFPAMADGLGLAGTYALYTVAAVISIFLVQKFIKETKGKELEEMEG